MAKALWLCHRLLISSNPQIALKEERKERKEGGREGRREGLTTRLEGPIVTVRYRGGWLWIQAADQVEFPGVGGMDSTGSHHETDRAEQ